MRATSTLAAAVALPALVLLGGCATIFTGTTDTLRFTANVPGVRLSIDGRYLGDLPMTLPMSRNFMGGQLFEATFEAPGYQKQTFTLKREFNMVAILDISSIPTSGGIDLLTGALMRFSPLDYHVQMVPEEATRSPEAAGAWRRSAELWRFALVNHRALQADVARGGGEHLRAFALLVADGDAAVAGVVLAAAVEHREPLVQAAEPHDFVARFDRMLAADPALAARRI